MNKTFKNINRNTYEERLNNLQDDLNNVKKEITYLDVYNIVEVCEDKNTFSSKANSLTPNSAMVINTESFFYNEETYNTGDIVLKTASDHIVHIKAQTGGIFFPNKITHTEGNYSISFAYQPTSPIEQSSEVGPGVEAQFAKEITFKNLSAPSASQTNIYGLWGKFNEINGFDCIYTGKSEEIKTPIKPYIKFYLFDEKTSEREEIIIDYMTNIYDGRCHIEVSNSVKDNLYMMVK